MKTSTPFWTTLAGCFTALTASTLAQRPAHALQAQTAQAQTIQTQTIQTQTIQTQTQPAQPQVQRDVVYGEAGGQQLQLDVYGAQAGAKRPALLLFHGGGWAIGSKSDMANYGRFFAGQGFVCFPVGYRLAVPGANKYPAQIDDAQRAVRWARAHADEYGVAPDKLGAFGESAGAHLAALLGTRDTRDNSDTTLAAYSSRVQCVVDLYGPTALTPTLLPPALAAQAPVALSPGAQTILFNFIGKTPQQAPDVYREASPLAHVDAKSAPFLIFHGGKDSLVPLSQSQLLDATLRAAGVESKLTVFPQEGHGFTARPDIEQTVTASLAFFNQHLKP